MTRRTAQPRKNPKIDMGKNPNICYFCWKPIIGFAPGDEPVCLSCNHLLSRCKHCENNPDYKQKQKEIGMITN